MLCACIDIGSNTTRMLVAEVSDGRLGDRHELRDFTRIGAGVGPDGSIPADKIEAVARVVSAYRDAAIAHGALAVRGVATAAVRRAPNRTELLDAVAARAGFAVELLSGADEARLAFLGATRTLGRALPGVIGVVDVGGGSTEVAVGTMADGVSWARSLPVGSGRLTDLHQPGDPASRRELEAMAAHAGSILEGVEMPAVATAVAVGGSAASLRRVVGPRLDPVGAEHVLAELCGGPAETVAGRLGLVAERVRLLPAGILILAAVADRLGCPLELGCGGIREGVCLELAATAPDSATR